MRLFRSHAYRKREVELNGMPLAAYQSIVHRERRMNSDDRFSHFARPTVSQLHSAVS